MIRFAIGYMVGFASAITFIVIWSTCVVSASVKRRYEP